MKKHKQKFALLNLILVVALIITIFAWTAPVRSDYQDLNGQLKEKEAEKEQLLADLEEVKGAGEQLDEETEVVKNRVEAAIPSNLSQDSLINQINAIAQQYQVSINSISFSIPVNSIEEIKKATVNVSLSGDRADLVNFLEGIENNSRKLLVKNITVQFGEVEGIGRINFNISMDTYYRN